MPPFRPTPVRPVYYFGNKQSNTILVQMVERHQVRLIDDEVAMIRAFSGTDDFLLACVRVTDWNEDLTPWIAPGLFGKSDFSGRGPQTLDHLLKDAIPLILQEHADALAGRIEPHADFSSLFPPSSGQEDVPSFPASSFDPAKLFDASSPENANPPSDSGSVFGIRLSGVSRTPPANNAGSENTPKDTPALGPPSSGFRMRSPSGAENGPDASGVRLFLGGYSLAALFCLWTAYQTDIFSGIAAASPSLWYPDFVAYMEENRILTDAVYLSLGTKEDKIRNRVMSRVGDATRAADEILSSQGILHTLEWNPGKHFQDTEKRTAMGFAWLLKNRYIWTMLD